MVADFLNIVISKQKDIKVKFLAKKCTEWLRCGKTILWLNCDEQLSRIHNELKKNMSDEEMFSYSNSFTIKFLTHGLFNLKTLKKNLEKEYDVVIIDNGSCMFTDKNDCHNPQYVYMEQNLVGLKEWIKDGEYYITIDDNALGTAVKQFEWKLPTANIIKL